ncbi:PE family protein [Mycobacterium bourgelatii]|nr:PE family protein [Mycobacterium bourgelatii]MCV6975385.1 PE family protein [Mycobacterium bourgelatii]
MSFVFAQPDVLTAAAENLAGDPNSHPVSWRQPSTGDTGRGS